MIEAEGAGHRKLSASCLDKGPLPCKLALCEGEDQRKAPAPAFCLCIGPCSWSGELALL